MPSNEPDARDSKPLPPKQRRELVERILSSAQFVNSQRLSAFLSFICEQERQGKAGDIREQQIGMAVFGRPLGYDVANDGIVRSQARFLRIRLENYFLGEGSQEEYILRVPKGCYQPAFESRVQAEIKPTENVVEAHVPSDTAPRRLHVKGLLTFVATLLMAIPLCWLTLRHSGSAQAEQSENARFWRSILDARRTPIIVPSDSSLVLLEQASGRNISLYDYMNRRFLSSAPPSGTSPALWRTIALSQYTSLADLDLVSRIEQSTVISPVHVQLRPARDLSLPELKQSNAILIGGSRSNPWVELFWPSMHFAVDYDMESQRNFVWNRNPGAGESERYFENGDHDSHVAYGVIAYMHSLDGQGASLIVGGTSKAGTEAAAEFLLSRNFDDFLRGLAQGVTLHHFEILVSAENVNGESHNSKVVCIHRLD